MELWVIGLQITHHLGHSMIIVEGDSWVTAHMLKKLQNGSLIHKVSIHWRLATNLNLLKDTMKSILTIMTSHVKHEANKVAHQLANEEFLEGKKNLPLTGTRSLIQP